MRVHHLRRRGLGLAAAAGLWLAVVGPVQAAGDAIDQSQQIATNSNSLSTPMAQTFTAGADGQVDRVSLMISTPLGPISATAQLRTVSGGKPTATVIGTSSFSGSVNCCQRWHDFAFNPAVSVSKGTQYAIVIQSNPAVTWYDSYSFDTYPAGQMWLSSNGQWIYQTSFGRDFTFQTWVTSGSANRPPVVAASNAIVTANEGSPVTNSGTYSDPDGDNVSLTASAGSLTKTGAANGTWNWTAPAADEGPVQTVTITVNDGKGGTSSVSFTYTVIPVPPTVTVTGAPVSGPEGKAIALTGSATSPSAADTAAGFTLTWTAAKNGAAFATGTGPSLSITPDDEGTWVVTLKATDDGGNSATTAVTFTGANVAPTALIGGATHSTLVLVPLQAVTFTGGFTDPGVLDTHTGGFDYGDGSPADAATPYAQGGSGDLSDTHSYSAPGTYTVTYTVTDDDGGTGTATATVVVETPAQALAIIDSYVQTMGSLNNGEKNGLSAKLRAAIASATRGNDNATCGQLDAVMNDLVALTSNGRLSQADSDALSSSTWAVHRALGCTKVKVGWLTLSL